MINSEDPNRRISSDARRRWSVRSVVPSARRVRSVEACGEDVNRANAAGNSSGRRTPHAARSPRSYRCATSSHVL